MARSLTSDAYRAFIQGLVVARKSSDLSQVDLAARLGVPQSYVSKVERCERRLDIVEFAAIARAIGVEPGRLLDSILGERTGDVRDKRAPKTSKAKSGQ